MKVKAMKAAKSSPKAVMKAVTIKERKALPKKKVEEEAEEEKITKMSNADLVRLGRSPVKRSKAVEGPSESSGTDGKPVVTAKRAPKTKAERSTTVAAKVGPSESSGTDVKGTKRVVKTKAERSTTVKAKAPKMTDARMTAFDRKREVNKSPVKAKAVSSPPRKQPKVGWITRYLNEVPKPPVTTTPADVPVKPKRPVAGAWGTFLEEQRDAIVKSMPAGFKVTEVLKKAAQQFKALTDDERKVLTEKFQAKTETYKTAIETYNDAMLAGGHSLETPTKKRKGMELITPTKKHIKMVKVSPESLAKLGPVDADALHEASGLGYEEAFRSLVTCAALIEKKVPHDKIVRALRASGGKEKKAFAALSFLGTKNA